MSIHRPYLVAWYVGSEWRTHLLQDVVDHSNQEKEAGTDMLRNWKSRGVALVATVALLGGAAFVASGATGAYFSDTQPGTISGTIGCILVTASGGTPSGQGTSGQNFAFTDLMPGTAQTITVNYQNTCPTNAEDVWITFPNPTALSALNNLGRYGTVHVTSAGAGAVGDVFYSQNLNDNSVTCTPVDPGHCWPLPSQLKVANNVGPTASGSVTFSFMYASALSSPLAEGGPWNAYPVPGQFINPGPPTTSGLPYAIVATQPGITPGAVGTLP